jgi:hypothetical protein
VTAPARRRTRKPLVTLPEAKPGKFFVALTRGKVYHLAEPNIRFTAGVPQEVSQAVHAHLAKAVDHATYVDPGTGRVRRTLHKFEASPPFEPILDEILEF